MLCFLQHEVFCRACFVNGYIHDFLASDGHFQTRVAAHLSHLCRSGRFHSNMRSGVCRACFMPKLVDLPPEVCMLENVSVSDVKLLYNTDICVCWKPACRPVAKLSHFPHSTNIVSSELTSCQRISPSHVRNTRGPGVMEQLGLNHKVCLQQHAD